MSINIIYGSDIDAEREREKASEPKSCFVYRNVALTTPFSKIETATTTLTKSSIEFIKATKQIEMG